MSFSVQVYNVYAREILIGQASHTIQSTNEFSWCSNILFYVILLSFSYIRYTTLYTGRYVMTKDVIGKSYEGDWAKK